MTLGFPQWQVAMICQDGIIKAFPIDGSEYSSIPKLPKKKCSLFIDRPFYYDNFGVFYKDTLVYLTTDPDRDVVKHKADDLFSIPKHLPNTRIPNQHIGGQIMGVHVGHYFWIIGGEIDVQTPVKAYSHKVQIKSSLWSLKRDVWINGPEIPEGLIKDSPCATAINDTFAIIININSFTDRIPVQAYDFSKGVWHPMSKPPIEIPLSYLDVDLVTVYGHGYQPYV